MAMNLECMLLLQKFGLLNSRKSRFLDIGPQNVYFCTVEQIDKFLIGQGIIDGSTQHSSEIDRLVYYSTPRADERTTLFSEIADLSGIEYNSFDVCPALKTELLDLNFDPLPDKYRNYYDVVTNFGTTEHVFNQWNSFSVIHGATRIGGAMYHVVPASGYLEHGYYCYTPLFFRDLAKANGYEIVDMFMAPAGYAQIETDIRRERQFDIPGSGATPPAGRGIPAYNLHVILRKRVDGPFRAALEVATAHATVDERMSARYAETGDESQPIAAAPDQRNELLALVERLSSERDHLQRESILRMQERDEKSAEIITKEAHVKELLRDIESRGVELDANQARLQELVERIGSERDHLQRESTRRMQERDEKSAELVANEACRQEQLALVEQLRSERDQLQRESTRRMQERDEKSAEIIVKEARIQELRRACEDRDTAISAREAQLQAVYRSISWRMSKPLRALRLLVRRRSAR